MEKIWLKSYPEGMPAEVPEPAHRSLRDMFEHSFSEWPDNPAFTCMGTSLSYRELDALSFRFACYLQKSLGLTRGERVATTGRTSCPRVSSTSAKRSGECPCPRARRPDPAVEMAR